MCTSNCSIFAFNAFSTAASFFSYSSFLFLHSSSLLSRVFYNTLIPLFLSLVLDIALSKSNDILHIHFEQLDYSSSLFDHPSHYIKKINRSELENAFNLVMGDTSSDNNLSMHFIKAQLWKKITRPKQTRIASSD